MGMLAVTILIATAIVMVAVEWLVIAQIHGGQTNSTMEIAGAT